jgi:SpoIID/LytB domain protein
MRSFGQRQGLLIRAIKDLHSVEVMEWNMDGRPKRYKIIEPGGTWYHLSAEELRLACNASLPPGEGVAIDRASRVSSGDMTFVVSRAGQSGGSAAISGRGFGHGVGMCQFCANGFARRGETWQTMLRRFYPGASIVRAYE